MGKDVVPQRFAQPLHGCAFAGERAVDEVERAPQLEIKREVAHGAFFGQAAAHQFRDRLVGERHRQRCAALHRLALDQRVELRNVAVIANVQQGRFQQSRGLPRPVAARRRAVAQPRRKARSDHACERLAVVRQVTGPRARRQPHDQFVALRAERVAENDVREGREEFAVGSVTWKLACIKCNSVVQNMLVKILFLYRCSD